MTLEPGTRIGRYEILGLLGAGGMGEVYRARDERLDREVAVKVLLAARDPDRRQRFEREARAVGALNHPNVLAVYDVGDHRGAPYLVSELLDGETLRQRLQATPRLPARKAADCATQIARGLAAAHDQGILHRDLKPENLFLIRDGGVKILDFGLAKLTAPGPGSATEAPTEALYTLAGTVMGTVGYMSPEQVRSGGAPITLDDDSSDAHGADWAADGTIVFTRTVLRGLSQVAAASGTPSPLTVVEASRGEVSHLSPQVLPGDRAVLFTVVRQEGPQIEIVGRGPFLRPVPMAPLRRDVPGASACIRSPSVAPPEPNG